MGGGGHPRRLAALQAATFNAARQLGVDKHIGLIHEGYDADLLMVDGNPLQDIAAIERISAVIFPGRAPAIGPTF